MQRPIDINTQFAKLFPHSAAPASRKEMLETVRGSRDAQRRLGARGHWTYDLNRHQSLLELYDAIERTPEEKRAAA